MKTAGGPHSVRTTVFPGSLSGTHAIAEINRTGLRWKVGWEHILHMLIGNLAGELADLNSL